MRRFTIIAAGISAACACSAFATLPTGSVGLGGAEGRSLHPDAQLSWLSGVETELANTYTMTVSKDELAEGFEALKELLGGGGDGLESIFGAIGLDTEISVSPQSCEYILDPVLRPSLDFDVMPEEMAVIGRDYSESPETDEEIDATYWGSVDATVVRSGAMKAMDRATYESVINDCSGMEVSIELEGYDGQSDTFIESVVFNELPFDLGAEDQFGLITTMYTEDDDNNVPKVSHLIQATATVDDYTFLVMVSYDEFSQVLPPDTLDAYAAVDLLEAMISAMENPPED